MVAGASLFSLGGAGLGGADAGLNSSEIFGISLPEFPMPNLSRQRALPELFEVS
jgi:hypothetical protein